MLFFFLTKEQSQSRFVCKVYDVELAFYQNAFTICDKYGITGCGIFKVGIQNWKDFCIKINCSQMKLPNFEHWTNGEPQ